MTGLTQSYLETLFPDVLHSNPPALAEAASYFAEIYKVHRCVLG